MLQDRLKKASEDLRLLNKKLTEDAVKYNVLIGQKKEILKEISEMTSREKVLFETCQLLQESCAYSRQRIKGDIEKTVSLALKEIFCDPKMGFVIKYDSAHNKPTANFFVTKEINGNFVLLNILDECGGGVADIVALAIRVVLLVYHSTSLSKVLILDEACTSISNFSEEVLSNFGKWIRAISDRHDIQVLLITQKEELSAHAEKTLLVSIDDNGVSHVK